MNCEAPSHGAADVVDWLSWWGDVEFVDDGSGEVVCHFGPVAYVEFADGTGQRYQALTVGELNAQIAHLGIEIDCPPDQPNHAEGTCGRCAHWRRTIVPNRLLRASGRKGGPLGCNSVRGRLGRVRLV